MSASTANTAAASTSPGSDWPDDIFQALKAHDVHQVCHVPDAGHARLIKMCTADTEIRTTTLTTEEEGVALLLGAWLGGKRGALLMQCSGTGNIVNMLGLARTCRFPLLMLVTMRGEWGEFNPWQIPMGQATRPVLEAMGTTVHNVTDKQAVGPTVDAAAGLAFSGLHPVAVTLSQQLIGTKTFED